MILLNPMDKRAIYEQIVEKLSERIMQGILQEHTPLPSVRSLATELSINPNTVQRAYAELERLGYSYSVKGKGSFVAAADKTKSLKQLQLKEQIRADIAEAKRFGIARDDIIGLVEDVFRQ